MREANDRGYECLIVEDATASYFPEFKRVALAMLMGVLDNQPGAARDIVVFNAGVALYAANVADSIKAGIEMARQALASGAAKARLDSLDEHFLHNVAAPFLDRGAARGEPRQRVRHAHDRECPHQHRTPALPPAGDMAGQPRQQRADKVDRCRQVLVGERQRPHVIEIG